MSRCDLHVCIKYYKGCSVFLLVFALLREDSAGYSGFGAVVSGMDSAVIMLCYMV